MLREQTVCGDDDGKSVDFIVFERNSTPHRQGLEDFYKTTKLCGRFGTSKLMRFINVLVFLTYSYH